MTSEEFNRLRNIERAARNLDSAILMKEELLLSSCSYLWNWAWDELAIALEENSYSDLTGESQENYGNKDALQPK